MRRSKKKELRPVVIEVANPHALLKRRSVIVLDLEDETAAVEVAQKIADATGRAVTVRNADMDEIHAIPAAKSQ
jgi:hypothetical protein